jgi:hypothetical protein
MAVKVNSKANSETRVTHVTEHADGKVIHVQDGHLFVLDGQGTGPNHSVAVYAPGIWVSAEIGK